jgi:vacuolar iron transporter family protein
LYGAALPFVVILVAPVPWRIPITVLATIVSLAVTGATAARIGDASVLRGATRVVVGGALALGATYLIDSLLQTTGIS